MGRCLSLVARRSGRWLTGSCHSACATSCRSRRPTWTCWPSSANSIKLSCENDSTYKKRSNDPWRYFCQPLHLFFYRRQTILQKLFAHHRVMSLCKTAIFVISSMYLLTIRHILLSTFQQKKKLRLFISNTFYPAKHDETVGLSLICVIQRVRYRMWRYLRLSRLHHSCKYNLHAHVSFVLKGWWRKRRLVGVESGRQATWRCGSTSISIN